MPLPSDELMRNYCQSAVHRGLLYIVSQDTLGVKILRTRTTKECDWESFSFPPETTLCHGILSYKDRLFILCGSIKSVARNLRPHILELLEINGRLVWHELPNGDCPVRRYRPAFFGAGNSLVLAGGCSSTDRLSGPTSGIEYNLSGNNWMLMATINSATVPEEALGLQSVTVDNCVHLIGGYDTTLAPRNATFSVNLKDGRPASECRTDITNALPDTPHSQCGACHVHGNVVVAGGYDFAPVI